MKKYKLIKKYPGSPSLGTIASCSKGHDSIKFESPKGEIHYSGALKDYILEIIITSNPEFWEEIVEKDYQVLQLALMDPYVHRISDVSENSDTYINSLLACAGNYIHSVRRLRDGEVFTVGDQFMDGKISTIKVSNNQMWIFHNGNRPNIKLKEAKKIKTPLFTTEDGTDIYEGDEYFELALTFEPQFREAIYKCTGRPNINYDYNTLEGKKKLNEVGIYYFSKREAAEEYTLMNNPCLSINEVMNITYNPTETFTSTSNKLKELVKSKLNESKD